MQGLASRSLWWLGNSRLLSQVLAGLLIAATAAALASVLENEGVLFGIIGVIGVLGAGWFATTERPAVALAILMLYLGLLDGYLKLSTGNNQVSAIRDVLLYALVIGLLIRSQVARRPLTIPPLSLWVIGFAVIVLAQLANPNAGTLMHSLGGVRQHLEFIPLFFLAYMFVQTTNALRTFVIVLLLVAAANGVVGYIQFNLTPEELSGWGDGYSSRINGEGNFAGSARTFEDSGGNERVRPFALGSESGAGGLFGALAIPGGLALAGLASMLRWRLLAIGLTGLAAVAVLSSQGRGSVVYAVLAVVAYGVLSATTQRRAAAILGLAAAGCICFLVVSSIVENEGSSSFRYRGLNPSSLLETTDKSRGTSEAAIPRALSDFPMGAGLAVAGPASGQGGGSKYTGRIDAESEYSFLVLETGIPGALLLIGFTLSVIVLGFLRCRREPDPEARVLLAAIIAPVAAMIVLFYPSAVTATVPLGPYLWAAGGIAAYWLVTRQRELRL